MVGTMVGATVDTRWVQQWTRGGYNGGRVVGTTVDVWWVQRWTRGGYNGGCNGGRAIGAATDAWGRNDGCMRDVTSSQYGTTCRYNNHIVII